MLKTLLERSFSLNHPAAAGRVAFLQYFQEQGTRRTALRNVSGQLLHVVRLPRLCDVPCADPQCLRGIKGWTPHNCKHNIIRVMWCTT